MRLTLGENAERLARYCDGLRAGRLHFVGHSTGGVVVLRLLASRADLAPGRVVLAGTPLAGSFAAHRLTRLPGGRAALGRTLPEWLAAAPSLEGVGRDIGVIAGSLPLGIGRIVAPHLPGPSDGVVSVAETRLPGVRDHVVLRVSHSGMLVSRTVARQICAFLHDGAFETVNGGWRMADGSDRGAGS
jgi:pimeloyl-ACP methyl ester carboxylesterase